MEFMEPVPYYAATNNDASALRSRAAQLEAELGGLESRNAPWVERQRVQAELDSVTRKLDGAELDRQLARRRQQDANQTANSGTTGIVTKGLFGMVRHVFNRQSPSAPTGTVHTHNAGEEQKYAVPVPYFTK